MGGLSWARRGVRTLAFAGGLAVAFAARPASAADVTPKPMDPPKPPDSKPPDSKPAEGAAADPKPAVAESTADASPRGAPWVDRMNTLPRATVALSPGIGIGTAPRNDRIANSYTGAGMNLEAAWGITDGFEIGVRSSLRLDADGRAVGSDYYARTFDLETNNTRTGSFTNPELRGRLSFLRVSFFELAGELRLYVPIEPNSREGVMFALPMAFHIAHKVRIDTGAFFPVLFYNPVYTAASVPLHLWYQTSEKFWLGPLAGVTFQPGGRRYVAGFGFGYQPRSWVDLRLQIVDPAITTGIDRIGLGFGAEFRID